MVFAEGVRNGDTGLGKLRTACPGVTPSRRSRSQGRLKLGVPEACPTSRHWKLWGDQSPSPVPSMMGSSANSFPLRVFATWKSREGFTSLLKEKLKSNSLLEPNLLVLELCFPAKKKKNKKNLQEGFVITSGF